MSDNNDNIIDKFLRGEANDEEQKALFNDADLKDELQFKKDLQSALGNESRQLMKDKLIQLDQKIVARQSMNKFFIIIGILLFIVIGSLVIWNNTQSNSTEFNTKTAEEVFAANFEPYPNIIAPIVKGDNEVTEREKAFQLYEQGDYETALPLLNELAFEKEDTIALFYHANILLTQNKTTEAISQLKTVTQFNQSAFSQPAEWYLALAFVKNNQIDEAKKLVNNNIVSNENHPYYRSAITLVKHLNLTL